MNLQILALMGQFPYQISLRSMQNSHFCGGFIISNRWLGSAGKFDYILKPKSSQNV